MGIENREIKEHRKKECLERRIHGLKENENGKLILASLRASPTT